METTKLNLYPIYQPIVDRGFKLLGYESFIRGKDARHVIDRFSNPSLEFLDEIISLDTQCKQLALQEYKDTVPLFINSHPYSRDPFPAPLTLPQYDLVIEITEQALVHDEQKLLRNVERLAASGVCFAIDDFGYGHFSLPSIEIIRPAYIKLARQVVHSCNSERSLNMLRSILAPFKEMGIQIIAEGIETEQQFQQMQSVADAFQGYWIALPRRMTDKTPFYVGRKFFVVNDR